MEGAEIEDERVTSLIIIPTYNEKGNIRQIVEKVLSLSKDFKVLIIDDNSPDGTGVAADALSKEYPRVSVIHRFGRLGLGTAYVEGFRYALAQKDIDYIFEMDADFSHDPNDLLRLIEGFRAADVVVGSRYIGGIRVTSWDLTRLFISRAANIFVYLVTGLKVIDSTAGFVGYKKKVLESLDLSDLDSNGYAFQIEMKYKVNKKGFKIKEIPIIFYGRKEGESKFNIRIILEAFLLVWKLRFRNTDKHG